MSIGLVDLARQRAALEPGLSAAMSAVIESGRYIGGPALDAMEQSLAERVGVPHVMGCGSGTDALILMLMGAGIGHGDAVIVPSLTFVATAEAVALVGATPVFADVRADMTLCPKSTEQAIDSVLSEGAMTLRAVIAVDLFSLPADHDTLADLCKTHGLKLFYDAAHSIGTETPIGACGAYGDGAATSFYPAKAIGCYGDGGAVFCSDPDFAAKMRRVLNHGNGGAAGHTEIGLNARLDSLQAAVVLEKLKIFDTETARRREIALHYADMLGDVCDVPRPAEGVAPVWSYYCITHRNRDGLKAHLAEREIGSVAYYARTTEQHPAYASFPVVPGGMPQTARFSEDLLCIPLHPYMTDAEVEQVVEGVRGFNG